MVDLGQVERFALRFTRRERSQDSEKPGLQVVCEFNRITLAGNQLLDSFAIVLRYDALERIVVAIERRGQHRRRDVGLLDGVDRPAELGRDDVGALDQLGRASGDFERGIVGRMDRAEKVGGRQSWLLDPPHEAIGVDEIVGARRLGRREPFDMRKVGAATSLGRLGLRERDCQKAEKESAGAGRSPHHAHSFLKATSSIRWLAPFVKRRSARGRVGRMFSCRLTRLIRRQIDRAVASASASLRSAY